MPELTENRVPAARQINAGPADGPELVRESIWTNPTDKPVRLPLYVGTRPMNRKLLGRPLTSEEKSGIKMYQIEPGTTVSLPSEFDRAIQDVRDGVIVGGLGPTLVKHGTQFVLHPSLDSALAEQKAAYERATRALVERQVHTEALITAEAQYQKASGEVSRRAPAPAAPEEDPAPVLPSHLAPEPSPGAPAPLTAAAQIAADPKTEPKHAPKPGK